MKNVLLSLSLLVALTAFSQKKLINNINVVDVENGVIIPNQNVLIEGNNIKKISAKKIRVDKQDSIIEGSGKYLMPGMIDTHMHFFQTGGLYTRPDALDMRKHQPYEDEIAFARELGFDNFKRYLSLGITTVIDVGGPFTNFEVRDKDAANTLSPNVLVTGPLFSPYQPDAFSKLEDTPIAKINTIEEADILFNKMLPYKPDFLKIWYINNTQTPAITYLPVVQHIAELAHKNDIKLAVHATEYKTAKYAVKAGADILVHSVDDALVDDAFAKMLVDNNVLYVPTLIVSKNYIKAFIAKPGNRPQDLKYGNAKVYGTLTDMLHYDNSEIPVNMVGIDKYADRIFANYAKTDSIMHANLRFLADKKVRIGTGTDAGNIGTLHASSYLQEQQSMEAAGLTRAEIIKASTIDAAIGFGLGKTLGSISKNKRADLLILSDNPLENLEHLNSITTVIKDGEIHKVETILKETPEQILQRQLIAYNARDIDAFLDTYSEDVVLQNYPHEVRSTGIQAMRDGYTNYFKTTKDLHCEITNRIVIGNKVIDQEYITANGQNFGAVAIYEVENGKIAKVTFL